jgi:uncharacterized protein with HEPN domain
VQGRRGLFALTVMICEISKNISAQTKSQNSQIPFKNLRDFRNMIHDLDNISKAKNLLSYVKNNENNLYN